MREFLYSDDLADACLFAMEHFENAELINVGSGENVTIQDLAKTIAGRIEGTELTWRTWKTLDNIPFVQKQRGWDVEAQGAMTFLDHVFDLQNYFVNRKIPYVMYNALPNSFETAIQDFEINTII